MLETAIRNENMQKMPILRKTQLIPFVGIGFIEGRTVAEFLPGSMLSSFIFLTTLGDILFD